MARLALTTIGILHEPYGAERTQGFIDRFDLVFGSVDRAPGFLGRVPGDGLPDRDPWSAPERFSGPEYQGRVPTTLSLWEDLESAIAFTYRNHHGAAMRDRGRWLMKIDVASHAAWWQDGDALPTWSEANARLERMWNGEGPHAFLLQRPYAPDGTSYQVDRDRIRWLADSAGPSAG